MATPDGGSGGGTMSDGGGDTGSSGGDLGLLLLVGVACAGSVGFAVIRQRA